ncbi:hypothetical protein PSI9734_00728 [Pseudidiomarina piscicola]|uniref:Cellulose biosynthesis protein BcsG n=1 Tax=Pseudidiomarina piscicola TaxID=2614830 RepID=A0A6S6WKV8_9GAMM|nr:cellulose biosynthesis protein BcsG [Pseudidiomarina piscicola]CAB0150161.1 hypothetical protein PSI9734_00728 [Pseudidiomarina piscicola]VZT39600.1 hypothetical protein PSI9734_00728 [Pseudomonas aeruginosa]
MEERSLYWRQKKELLNRPMFIWPGLSAWAFYFIAKSLLALNGDLSLALWLNLAMISLLVIPVRPKALKVLRQCIAVPCALSLLYYESHLPPFSSIVDQWSAISGFSFAYLTELFARTVELQWLLVLLVAWIAYAYIQQVLRMTVVAIVMVVIASTVSMQQSTLPPIAPQSIVDLNSTEQRTDSVYESPDAKLAAFYQEQKSLVVQPLLDTPAGFDVLIVNICSLSWDDIAQSGLQQHPLLTSSQLVLKNYNSASSYSGPSALRLLRASCGHSKHEELYTQAPQCLVSRQLAELGFSSELLLNHTGEYDNFSGLLQQYGGLPQSNYDVSAPVAMTGFDNSLIRSDQAVLDNWLADTAGDSARFTFYNTLSLHDGNRVPNFSGNSLESYEFRAAKLMDELYQLQQKIEASGRRVLMAIVPEHGANLAGDNLQLPGLREVPTPPVTHVPVLISLFGEGLEPPTEQIAVERTTGPTAITSAIFNIHAQQPFANSDFSLSSVAEQLPATDWVAENKDVKVMEFQQNFVLKIKERDWLPYRQ